MKGILGQKIGMTQVFLSDGNAVAVTVVHVKPNVVTKKLTIEKNKYVATQLAFDDYKPSKLHSKKISKPLLGQFKQANTAPKHFVKEIRNMDGYDVGAKIGADLFTPGEYIDVQAMSKGKGFAGTIKRHNQKIGPKSHGGGGGSKAVRQVGSIGTRRIAHTFKGMTMPGHLGAETTTVHNLVVINVDPTNEILLIKGSIPGPNKSYVIIRQAVKKSDKKLNIQISNIREALEKNMLLDEAKKYGANVNTSMSLDEMKNAVKAAEIASDSQEKVKKLEEEIVKSQEAIIHSKEAIIKIKNDISSAEGDAKADLEKKLSDLEKSLHSAEEKANVDSQALNVAKVDAATKTKAAEALQVEDEVIEEEKEAKVGDANGK